MRPNDAADPAREQPTVLVVAGPHGPLVERPRRAWDRLLARLRASRLDAELAAGSVPDHDRLRAVRAAVLVDPVRRETLARNWTDLLDRARRSRSVADPRPALARRRVLAAETEIRELANGLRARVPVPARGVAMANLLLTDGIGPLYNARSQPDLPTAIRAAIEHLDPVAGFTATLDGVVA